MIKALNAIPLPLRIATLFLLVLAAFALARNVSGSLIQVLAMLLWIVTMVVWMYDQGWLNPLARVPGISTFLAYMSNRSALSGPSETANPSSQPPPGELNSADRQRVFELATQSLNALRGNLLTKDLIQQKLIDPAQENPSSPFSANAPAMIVFLVGPKGVGMTTAAEAIAQLLTGVGAIKTAKIVTVREIDLRSSSSVELANAKATAARGGSLVIDDADWLISQNEDQYSPGNPGVDFGLTLLDAISKNPGQTLILATMSEDAYKALKEDKSHTRWLNKLTTRELFFDHLEDEDLFDVFLEYLNANNWALGDDKVAKNVKKLLATLRVERESEFENTTTCRRLSELLIELATESEGELATLHLIEQKIVDQAEELI